jgi:hypothetical protein
MQTLNPSYGGNYVGRPPETLNSSISSSKNVDCSDIVLKGDVKPTLKRNFSAVESSHKTLNVNNSIATHHIPNKNMRYDDNSQIYSEAMMSKNSPDFKQKLADYSALQNKNYDQQALIEKLQSDVLQLKGKLEHYELTCKCHIKVKT